MRSEKQRSGSFIEARRRAQIVDAAIETVNRVGYPRASLAVIAETAGISKSIISYHFSGKEELLLSLMEHVFEDLGEELVARVVPLTSPSERLLAYVRTYLQYMHDHRAGMLAAMEIMVSHRTAEGVPLYLIEGEDDTALLEAIVTAGIDAGEFRAVDVTVTVTTIVHALDGGLTRAQIHPDTDLLAFGEHLADLLLAMVRA